MKKDRKAIRKILNNSDQDSPASEVDQLERLVQTARVEAMGWTHADACNDLDAGKDPRQKEVPEMLGRALMDLATE